LAVADVLAGGGKLVRFVSGRSAVTTLAGGTGPQPGQSATGTPQCRTAWPGLALTGPGADACGNTATARITTTAAAAAELVPHPSYPAGRPALASGRTAAQPA